MKPMIIVPPELLAAADRKALEENGICVVVASDPAKLRFADPMPAASSRNEIEHAAIKFSRILLNRQWGNYSTLGTIGIDIFTRIYVDCLIEGTQLDKAGCREEQEQAIIDSARRDELARIGREEARSEAAARKAAKAAVEGKRGPGRPSNAELAAREAAKKAAAAGAAK